MQTRLIYSPIPERQPPPFRATFRKLLDRIHTKVLEFRAPNASKPTTTRVFINHQLSAHPNIGELQFLMGKAKLSSGKITPEEVHSLKELYLGILPELRDLLLDQQIYVALITLNNYSTNLEVRETALNVLDSVPEGGIPSFTPVAQMPKPVFPQKEV